MNKWLGWNRNTLLSLYTFTPVNYLFCMSSASKSALLTRRAFTLGTAAFPALITQAGSVLADIEVGTAGRITTLSDGYLSLPPEMVFGRMPQKELAEVLKRHGADTGSYTPPCNAALYRDGTHTVLFDAGSGPGFMETAGTLPQSLEAAGLSVEDITHVVFTHAHPDHLWGVLDDFDDPLFPNAAYLMGRAEWDYWWHPETVNTIGEDRAAFASGARRRMEMIEDRVQRFEDGAEILPGIAARACFGHTPGHMAFEIRQGSEAVMIAGDAITNAHVAFERPDWFSGTDQDQTLAAAARISLLGQIADGHMRMAGFHLPGSGIGRAERKDGAFRFVGDPS